MAGVISCTWATQFCCHTGVKNISFPIYSMDAIDVVSIQLVHQSVHNSETRHVTPFINVLVDLQRYPYQRTAVGPFKVKVAWWG
jgi:hypothetical protein